MSAADRSLQECRAFTRGFLLALDWAGQPPDPDHGARVPRLAGEDLSSLYRSFRALPPASRQGLRISWAKRDRLRRIDEAVELHPSWLIEILRDEPPALLLLALGELRPELARPVLRELWPHLGSRTSAATVDLRPLPPSLSGAFRRELFARFVHLPRRELRGEPLAPLFELSAAEIWLLVLEIGRQEIARARSGGAAAGRALLEAVRPVLPETAARDLGHALDLEPHGTSGGPGPSGAASTAVPASRGGAAADPEARDARDWVGLHVLARCLALRSRDRCLHLAQRMDVAYGHPLVRWRDEAAGPPAADAGEVTDRVLERAREILARRKSEGEERAR